MEGDHITLWGKDNLEKANKEISREVRFTQQFYSLVSGFVLSQSRADRRFLILTTYPY